MGRYRPACAAGFLHGHINQQRNSLLPVLVEFAAPELWVTSVGAVFHECNLLGAMFDQTNLEKADLRTAINFSIYPEQNKLKKANQ